MEFLITIKVDVPDHIADTMPTAPDLQSEFQSVVNRAVSSAVEKWAVDQSGDRIRALSVEFDVPSKEEQH